MPGMFWLVIVTMNSGTAIAKSAPVSKCGVTRANSGAAWPSWRRPNTPRATMTTTAATRAPSTAHRRAKAVSASQTRITGAIAHGSAWAAVTGAITRSSSTPASIADANAPGMRSTSSPRGRTRPQSASSAPQITNAPTAEANPPFGTAAVASSAAPGVDHAMVIGIFRRQLNSTQPRPIVRQSANNPDAACASDAPTARSPVSTTANELVKPTSPQTTPARTVCRVPMVFATARSLGLRRADLGK